MIRCPVCGRILLERDGLGPLEDGTFVTCVHCARLFQVDGERLVRAFLGFVDPTIRELFEIELATFWQDRIRDVVAA